MARRPRGDRPGSWHHVVNRAIAKRPYFETRGDQRYFLARLASEVRSGRLQAHAFCLMTTHFHLLVRSPVGEWLVDHCGRTWHGSEHARVALLRRLCAATWAEVAAMTGWTVDLARRRYRVHREVKNSAPRHLVRVEGLATLAVSKDVEIGS